MENKQVKVDPVSVESPIQNPGAVESIKDWKKVPAEIWKKIFEFVQYTGNKDVTKLREVCSFFRNVIDEHVDFHVVLNRSRLNRPTPMGHIRVKTCKINDCTKNNAQLQDCSSLCGSGNCPYFEQLTGMLNSSTSTLICLSLDLTHLPETLNAKIFQELTKLKTLIINFIILHESKPKNAIVGLKDLPDCIEKFEVSGLDVNDLELYELGKNSNLTQLKYLKVGLNWRTAVKPKIFKCLLTKRSLRKLSVGPMKFDKFQKMFVGNKIYLQVGSEFMVPLQDHQKFVFMLDVDLISVREQSKFLNTLMI